MDYKVLIGPDYGAQNFYVLLMVEYKNMAWLPSMGCGKKPNRSPTNY